MKKTKYLLLISGLALVLSGCASTVYQEARQAEKEITPRISFAPAIDVSYAEVASDIKSNLGVNVRWGGRVIESSTVDGSTTRLTVYSHPLGSNGRPLDGDSVQQKSGRFIVDLADGFANKSNLNGHLVTFYGDVADELLVTNGSRQKPIPVINAEELVDWEKIDDTRNVVRKRSTNIYYGLGYNRGHFGSSFGHGFGSSYYGGYRGSHFGHGRSYRKFRSHGGHRSHRRYRH